MKTQYPFLSNLIDLFDKKLLLIQISDPNNDSCTWDFLCDWFVEESHELLDKQISNANTLERFQAHRQLEYQLVQNGFVVLGEDHWYSDKYQINLSEDEFNEFWNAVDNNPTDPFYNYKQQFEQAGDWI